MATYEFTPPSFLQNVDVEKLHQQMLALLPEDIDKVEAGFPWDFTRPTAVIASELLEFFIPEVIKLMFPQWSYGEFLNYIGNAAQVVRKSAGYATATVQFTGTPGTIIPTGTVLATEASGGGSSIEYATLELCSIGVDGTVDVAVQAVEAGIEGNVNIGAITLMSSPIDGVVAVTNTEAATGGTDEEEDDDYRERIISANESIEASFVGNNSDYKRWAEEVTGIGAAVVIPEWNGPETVKIACMDSNGEIANQRLLDAVYAHIMSPDDPMERLAPPNVILTVSAPTLVEISYAFTPEISPDYELATVITAFSESLAKYYKEAADDGEVKYIQVHALLTNTPGIEDFTGLTMNGGTANVTINQDEYPHTYSIDGGEE